ncbi:MAG: DNRLRE domain-containing protein [Planctomycetia bacterium]|nr:DNRLRE domain-containing protein [Planctomycetia bacterium]
MSIAKTSYRNRLLTIPKIIIIGLLFLFLFTNLIIAQSQSPKAKQWKSVGGQMVFSGKHEFKTNWLTAGGQMYWKNDERSTGIPATHSADEVLKDVVVKKGQITLRGPGHLGRVLRTKGGTGFRLDVKNPQGFFWYAFDLGNQYMYKIKNKWTGTWVTLGGMGDVDPSKFSNACFIPAGKTLTFDISLEAKWCQNCVWTKYHRGHGYPGDIGIELELWFFPQDGGKVVKVIKDCPDGKKIDITTGDKPCKKNDTPKIRLFRMEEGDMVEIDANGTGKWVSVTKDMLPIILGRNARIITGFESTVTIDFARRGLVRVKELTNYQVNEFLITDEGITAHTNMKVGEVNVKVDRKYKAIDFTVSSPTCVSSVRGTEFTITHKESPMKTTIAVHSGKVEVTPTICSAPAMIIYAGQRITVDENCFGELKAFEPDVKETERRTPFADSHVYAYSYRNWNKANLGKYNILRAGWLPTGGEKRAYLKFDLSGVNPANVGKATLKLFHNHTGGNNSLSLGVHRVTGTWQEGSDTYHSGQTEKTAAYGEISWVNQPTFDFNSIAYFNPGAGTNKWVEVDITPMVKAWLSGTPNFGLVIMPRGIMSGRSPVSVYGFYSREFEDADKHPILVLSGSGSVSPPDGGLGGDVIDSYSGGIRVLSATYGGNCNGVANGNVTAHIADQSNGKSTYRYTVDYRVIGDPAPWCAKTYTVRYRCGNNPQVHEISLPEEAGWGDKVIVLDCKGNISNSGVIKVLSATYGGNCNGVANGNVTAQIADQANGKSKYQYTVDHRIIGDPAPGCAKTYTVRYRCGNNPQVHEISLPKEAGWGDKSVVLDCEGN